MDRPLIVPGDSRARSLGFAILTTLSNQCNDRELPITTYTRPARYRDCKKERT
jgi:hypothetical protein